MAATGNGLWLGNSVKLSSRTAIPLGRWPMSLFALGARVLHTSIAPATVSPLSISIFDAMEHWDYQANLTPKPFASATSSMCCWTPHSSRCPPIRVPELFVHQREHFNIVWTISTHGWGVPESSLKGTRCRYTLLSAICEMRALSGPWSSGGRSNEITSAVVERRYAPLSPIATRLTYPWRIP